MNSKTLRAVSMITARGSLSAAAAELNISEAALSRQISLLEDSIKLKLFSRTGRALTPTLGCMEFLRQVDPILVGLERIPQIVTDIKRLPLRRFRLAVMPRLAAPIAIPAVSRFLDERPNQEMSLSVDGRALLERHVLDRTCDLALGSLPVHHTNIVSEQVCKLPTVAVLPLTHPKARRKTLNLAELEHENFVLLPPSTMIGMRATRMFDDAGIKPRSRILVSRFDECCEFVAQGQGVAILDALAPAWAMDRVGFVPIEGAPESRFGFFWKKGDDVDEAPKGLKQLIREEANRFTAASPLC